MPRRLLSALHVVLVAVGVLAQSIAWGQTDPQVATQVAVPGGGFMVNVGDLTFPGAVFLGLWMLARSLPGALRSWTPTIRVELVNRERDGTESRP